MSDSLEQTIADALTQSRELLSVAERGEWSSFEQRYRRRDDSLRRLDAEVAQAMPMNPELAQRVSAELEQLKVLNNQILSIAQRRQGELGAEASGSRRAQQAVDAYKR